MSIARVQGPFRNCQSSSSLDISLTSAPKYDNLLIAVIGTYGSYPPTIDHIYQDGVDWESQVDRSTSVLYGRRVAIWAGVVTSTSASTSLTIYLGDGGSGTTAYPVIADVCEYQGLQTVNFKDQTATYPYAGTNTRTLETGYTNTTTRPNELCVGGIFNVCNQGNGDNIDPNSATNNFTLLDGQGVQVGGQTKSLAYLEKIVSTTGIWWSGCYGGSFTTYEGFVGCIATFKGTVNNDCHLYDYTKWEVDPNMEAELMTLPPQAPLTSATAPHIHFITPLVNSTMHGAIQNLNKGTTPLGIQETIPTVSILYGVALGMLV